METLPNLLHIRSNFAQFFMLRVVQISEGVPLNQDRGDSTKKQRRCSLVFLPCRME